MAANLIDTELLTALTQLSLDMHTVSNRPCDTCKKITEAVGFPFGCYEYQAKVKKPAER
jgi:hypothetical protein